MVRARAGRVRRRVLPADARGHAQELRRPDDQGQHGRRRPRPEPQLPVRLAPGVRAGRRRRLPDQRARGARRWSTSSSAHRNIGAAISYHTHSGVILRPMGTQSDDDMIPEDLWSIKRFSELGAKLTGYPAISIWHDFKYHPKEVIGGTQDWVYEHLGRAVLGGRDLGAEQGGRHHRLQVDRLVPRAPGRRRPEAAEVERRAVRRPGARRLEAVHAPAARRGRDRRLGQDELLAQPAAAPARARGGALPGVDDADRAVAAQARAAAHRSARARRPTPGACASRSPTAAGCRPT